MSRRDPKYDDDNINLPESDVLGCGEDYDFEMTPELEARLKRSIQDCNDGLTYTMLTGEDGHLTMEIQCNPCGRVGTLGERPFPHKLNCPMKRL